MRSPVQTVCITTRRPYSESDAGEAAIVHYAVNDNIVCVTDSDGHLLRYSDGEPCRQALEPGDDPRQVAARLGRSYHNQTYGDRERGFWRDMPRINRRSDVV
jgi:hypothetical protein